MRASVSVLLPYCSLLDIDVKNVSAHVSSCQVIPWSPNCEMGLVGNNKIRSRLIA